jgi:NitT/TauT family transport system ATP-binding protein
VIDARAISHTFVQQGREIEVLKNVSLTVRAGEFVTIVGPSGCGKTTFLNLAVGLEPVQSGSLLVNGSVPRAGMRGVGYVFARDALLPWRTAAGNIGLALELAGVPRGERQERINSSLARVGLAEYANAYRAQLSQGMRQRVALARTLATRPSLLLMDEPYAALDAQTRIQLQEELATVLADQAVTVLFVTHDLGEAVALSDRLVILSRRPGKIKGSFKIGLPRPRRVRALQANPDFHLLYERVWEEFHTEVLQDTSVPDEAREDHAEPA